MSDKKIKQAFDSIKAEDTLKETTRKYLRAKTKNYKKSRVNTHRRLAVVMACLVVILTGIGGYGMYFTPVSAITIDSNPSVELGVNRFGKVISVDNYAAEESPLEVADVKHLNYSEAVERLLANQNSETTAEEDEEVFITVTGENQEQCEKMQTHLSRQTEKHGNVHCSTGSATEVEEARKAGISLGKYRAYLELKELDETVTLEDVKGLSMAQIRSKIEKLSGSTSATGKGHGEGHGKKHRKGHMEE